MISWGVGEWEEGGPSVGREQRHPTETELAAQPQPQKESWTAFPPRSRLPSRACCRQSACRRGTAAAHRPGRRHTRSSRQTAPARRPPAPAGRQTALPGTPGSTSSAPASALPDNAWVCAGETGWCLWWCGWGGGVGAWGCVRKGSGIWQAAGARAPRRRCSAAGRHLPAHPIGDDDWAVGDLKLLAKLFPGQARAPRHVLGFQPRRVDGQVRAEPGAVDKLGVEPLGGQRPAGRARSPPGPRMQGKGGSPAVPEPPLALQVLDCGVCVRGVAWACMPMRSPRERMRGRGSPSARIPRGERSAG